MKPQVEGKIITTNQPDEIEITESKMLHDFRCAALSGFSTSFVSELRRLEKEDKPSNWLYEGLAECTEKIAQAMLQIARGDK
jgi:hypothetical protein